MSSLDISLGTARRSFDAACREGQPEAIAFAIAMRSLLDQEPSLSLVEAYDLMVQTVETASDMKTEKVAPR